MIVRERKDDFIMIEQHNHAQISGDIMSNWQDSLYIGESLRKSVDYAIYMHDYGWKEFDKQPFWNDQTQTPYTFSDFPTYPKIVLYKHGINEVEKEDPYAALLCSEHYTRFLLNHTSVEAQTFIREEKTRQKAIWDHIKNIDNRLFNFHYGLLQLGDNLSLYLCLNEPCTIKENEHPFFSKGIPLASALIGFQQPTLDIKWKDQDTIQIHEFPFKHPFLVTIKQKTVSKEAIHQKGLIEAYEYTPFEEVSIKIQS
ncbi:DUF3891 family protein [Ornithinibacillus sp. L9]|uniref:DUF3891 family protein n=1 Tax=Ornithinibacillus caprae TaxID=2678566 RepID=A0A6N8FJC8_9BACI|nr:DUF3891 family protein [Ornithinibacillus caprae]MUK89351.1 DUF3891 family protein [Ornithinibacillus caprae]